MENKLNFIWDENPVDITSEANFIWSIANKLRGSYMPDHYGDVIIPMTILRRFECVLEKTKTAVVEMYQKYPDYPAQAMYKLTGYQFYNVSGFSLKELCNDADNIAANFKAYIEGFSVNVSGILTNLNLKDHIDKMDKDGCLFPVVKAFSELDLSVEKFDSIKMGYIFENLIGRFYQNVDAGQYYTGRDIIKTMIALLISEGSDDIFEDGKIITVADQAAGTGGMLSTAFSYLKHYNPGCIVHLYGVELMPQTHAIGLAEMLIKGQTGENFVNADTFKTDPFPNNKFRYILENPPFGTPWGGKDAKVGQEDAVKKEFEKGLNGRWGAGLPSSGDGQLLFIQSAVAKMDPEFGRAAIIENGSPLFTGGTSSGESQIRRWLLENDLIEAIIQIPTDMFYNTGISTYIWILSKCKRPARKGFVQLIDASSICHKLRKSLGNKKNEFLPEDRVKICELYTAYEENEYCKIFPNTEFIYREYTVMQPLQRSYAITEERIEILLQSGALSSIYDEAFLNKIDNTMPSEVKAKDKKKYEEMLEQKPLYKEILARLNNAISDKVYLSPIAFMPVITKLLSDILNKQMIEKIASGLSVMDKTAEILKDKKGNIIYDKDTKDTEIVRLDENIDDYMAREVLPHVPDAKAFFEENLTKSKTSIKTGAEIPFTRYFYKYQAPTPSEELIKQFIELENSISARIAKLIGGAE